MDPIDVSFSSNKGVDSKPHQVFFLVAPMAISVVDNGDTYRISFTVTIS